MSASGAQAVVLAPQPAFTPPPARGRIHKFYDAHPHVIHFALALIFTAGLVLFGGGSALALINHQINNEVIVGWAVGASLIILGGTINSTLASWREERMITSPIIVEQNRTHFKIKLSDSRSVEINLTGDSEVNRVIQAELEKRIPEYDALSTNQILDILKRSASHYVPRTTYAPVTIDITVSEPQQGKPEKITKAQIKRAGSQLQDTSTFNIIIAANPPITFTGTLSGEQLNIAEFKDEIEKFFPQILKKYEGKAHAAFNHFMANFKLSRSPAPLSGTLSFTVNDKTTTISIERAGLKHYRVAQPITYRNIPYGELGIGIYGTQRVIDYFTHEAPQLFQDLLADTNGDLTTTITLWQQAIKLRTDKFDRDELHLGPGVFYIDNQNKPHPLLFK